jgi:hypothetical protein
MGIHKVNPGLYALCNFIVRERDSGSDPVWEDE